MCSQSPHHSSGGDGGGGGGGGGVGSQTVTHHKVTPENAFSEEVCNID
jgi:hypothetical protein